MKLLTAFLFFALPLASFAQSSKTIADKRLAGLDTAFERIRKEWKVAGFAIAVVEKDKVIYSKGIGYRDYDLKKPVTPNTLFAIGSCTKAFTASLLGILNKEGKISFDKKATDYLPALHFYNEDMNQHITPRDMMSHRTGLPRHDYSWYFFETDSRDTLLQRIQYQEPTADIREKWQYNNMMFLAQGMMAEKITGKSWEDNIKETIFGPLQMTRSDFSVTDLAKEEDASLGYTIGKGANIKKTDYFKLDGIGPAGSINSSVQEMANWVITWINKGKFGGKEVLPASYVQEAISSQAIIGAGLPTKEHPDSYFSNYGFGWFLSSYKGHYRAEHGGNIAGFTASTSFFPTDSIGIVVLSNQNGSAVPAIIRNMIADRLLALERTDWSGEIKKERDEKKILAEKAAKAELSNRVKGTHPSHPLTEYAGLFSHPGYGRLEIWMRNDSLFGKAGKNEIWLRHYHYDVFEGLPVEQLLEIDSTSKGMQLNFRSSAAGKIESVEIPFEPGLKPIEFKYAALEKPLSREDLENYTGNYTMAGITSRVYLKGDHLFLFVPGQPEYELVALGNHLFKLKIIEGYSVQFEVSGSDKASAAVFIQPNGSFRAMRKEN